MLYLVLRMKGDGHRHGVEVDWSKKEEREKDARKKEHRERIWRETRQDKECRS